MRSSFTPVSSSSKTVPVSLDATGRCGLSALQDWMHGAAACRPVSHLSCAMSGYCGATGFRGSQLPAGVALCVSHSDISSGTCSQVHPLIYLVSPCVQLWTSCKCGAVRAGSAELQPVQRGGLARKLCAVQVRPGALLPAQHGGLRPRRPLRLHCPHLPLAPAGCAPARLAPACCLPACKHTGITLFLLLHHILQLPPAHKTVPLVWV